MLELKELRSGDTAVDAYIQELENYILSFESSNIKKLITASDELSGVIARDLRIIAGKEKGDLKVLSEDKNDKLFDRALAIIGKVKDFNAVAELTKVARVEEKKEDKEVSVKGKLTAMEQLVLKKNGDKRTNA